MCTAAEGDTVWIGFMDIVPVIGTVKEAVELVLALYEGNKAVMNEKEKAIENIVKESLKKHMKANYENKLTPRAAAAEAADEFSGLRNVREVTKEMIIEYMAKGSKGGTKPPTSAEQKVREKEREKEREKRVKAIKEDMLEKIRILNPNFNEELVEEIKRSKRGEHVFNSNILKFHGKVLTDFIKDYHIANLQGYNQQAMNELGKHTLPPNTAKDIQTKMVVHFGVDEFYFNANAVVYGIFCRALREALLDVLRHINPGDVTEDEENWVNIVIDIMNAFEIYVDQFAKAKWIANLATRPARFDQVKKEVAHMYKTVRGVPWCIDILREVAPLFEQGQ